MARFILIHGAWHGRWCWDLLTPLLEAAGHQVLAPDLPGMGEDRTPLPETSVESWAVFVADLARARAEPAILVGHSRAGLVISRAAELAHEALAGLVYLAAFLVRNGETLEAVMRQVAPRPESAGSLQFSEDGASSTIAPDAFDRVFYNGSPPDLVARARTLSSAEPMASFTTPLAVSEERWGSVPRFYVECAKDKAISPQLQRRMQDRLPCRRTFAINTDHSPFYSAPGQLARHLLTIAAELDQGGHRSSTAP